MATKLHRYKGDQFFDANGDPLNGGKVYYYEAGTTDAQTTYSDPAGSTANSNPLTLDSSGRLTVPVYLGDSDSFSDFKETLTDSSDVTVSPWPFDDIPAATPEESGATFAPPLFSWTQVTNAASPVALSAADAGKAYEADTTSGNIEFDLPSAASVGDGKGFLFKKMVAANSMVIDPSGSETIDNSSTSITVTRQYQVVAIFSNGAEWYVAWQYVEDVVAARLPAAADDATGIIELAVQSEMEAASSASLAVTPGRQHFHPGHPKAGGVFDGTAGTPAFASGDYGMGAITDSGGGNYVVAVDTAFANENYWISGATAFDTLHGFFNEDDGSRTTSSTRVRVANENGTSTDRVLNSISLWGDYA